jgi:H+/gluconate symporter-like permease
VSLFVVAFAVYPIATALFRQADLPKRLIPGTIALGAFTFTMTALPGTPAIQNAIPMPYFGTTPFAAPGLGLIGGAVMLVLGTLWLVRRASKAAAQGEGYGAHDEENGVEHGGPHQDTHGSQAPFPQTSAKPAQVTEPTAVSTTLPLPPHALARALAPVVLVIVLNYLLATWLLPALDTGYLADSKFGDTSIGKVRGLWAVTVALATAIALLMWLQRDRLPRMAQTLEQGAGSSVMPLLNTASQVGFGAVIASLTGFAVLRDAVLTIAPDNPLVSVSIAVNLLAGITGSASGGMSIALQTLGETWLAMGQAAGIAPELLHRVTAIATGGLDALPHNGAVISLLGICGLSHRQSYADIFVVAVAIPVLALVVVVTLGSAFGSF